MVEKDTVFSSQAKYNGIFSFKDFYKFCYDWLTEEMGLEISEKKYAEKLAGDSKEIEVVWGGEKAITDYFKFDVGVKFNVIGLKKVEIMRGEVKESTNKGLIGIKVTGTLIRDYDGKFERSGFQKFLRSIYEKWVIHSRIEEFEDKLVGGCDGFLEQAKAYLDLEGRK